MRRLIAASLLFLGNCAMPDSSYVLDGVPVVLEQNRGPDQNHLAFVTHLYRKAAEAHWDLTPEGEQAVWRGLREIRWTTGRVPDNADYDAETATLYVVWTGCVLGVPYYQALTFHYAGEGLTNADLEWAHALEKENRDVVCYDENKSWDLPW